MFVSLNQLSHTLNLPAAWLRAQAKARRIPSLKVGRRLLFDPGLVARALSERAEMVQRTAQTSPGLDE